MRDVRDVVVIGAGQAGLATSFFLRRSGIDHLVLDRGRVAETWRSRRWDGFTLVGPNWSFDLPGFPYDGAAPGGFMLRNEIVERFERYAAIVAPPIETGVEVRALTHDRVSGTFTLDTSAGELRARQVVVATGAYQRPVVPATSLSDGVQQLHTDAYRRPDQLADGGVLIVGSGQSGCQIAEELVEAGRTVHLATGSCGWLPRRYRGRDNTEWRRDMGVFEDTVDVLPHLHARTACPAIQSGRGGGRDLSLRTLAAAGVVLTGRLIGTEGTRVRFAGDLAANLAASDEAAVRLRRSIDDHIDAQGISAPPEPDPEPPPEIADIETLDLAGARIGSVLWATGYHLDFGWIDLDLFDDDGYPVQQQGVTSCPGLYFLGLQFMYRRKSGIIMGVGDDAEHVCGHILSRHRSSPVVV